MKCEIQSIFLWLVLGLAIACTPKGADETPWLAPAIVSVTVEPGADYSEAVIICEVSATAGLTEFGFIWGEDEIIPPGGIVNRVFSARIRSLEFGKSYTYNAFIGNGRSRIESEKGIWTTENEIPPVPLILKTRALPGSSAGFVRISCRLPALDRVVQRPLLRYGICYSSQKDNPTLEDFSKETYEISMEGEYLLEINGLTSSSTVYFRPFAEIGRETSYGTSVAVQIPSSTEIVKTEDFESFATTAIMRGCVDMEWAQSLSAFGIVFGESFIPASGMDSEGLFSVERSYLAPGTKYSFRAYAEIEGMYYFGESVSFTTPELEVPEVEYVDLGLGVYWGVKNLGAAAAEDLGDLYAWGEIKTKQSFSWKNYRWCDGTSNVTKYNSLDMLQLLPEDDAATAALADGWRMPTLSDWENLRGNCQFVYVRTPARVGYAVTSKVDGYRDKGIFIPIDDYLNSASYWTSVADLVADNAFSKAYVYQMAHLPGSLGDDIDWRLENRCVGEYIRPVKEK